MRKDDFTTKCIVVAAIFEDSVSGVIPVSVDKISKMVEIPISSLGSDLGWFFAGFLQQ